jgi:GTPase SAR1 family protein
MLNVSNGPLLQYVGLKAVLLGNAGVGKTEVAQRLHDQHATTSTIGVDIVVVKLDFVVDQKHYNEKVILWDTAGQERFGCIIGPYTRNVHFYLLVCDLSDVESVKALVQIALKCQQSCCSVPTGCLQVQFDQACIHLIGNKADKRTADELVTDKARLEAVAEEITRMFPGKRIYYDICSAMYTDKKAMERILARVAQQYAEENIDDFLRLTKSASSSSPTAITNSPNGYLSNNNRGASCCTGNRN